MKTPMLLLIGLLFTGCMSVATIVTDDNNQTYTATIPDQIAVYSTDKIGRPYSRIGEIVVSADAGNNASKSVNQLKVEASKLGADAIINLKLEVGLGYWSNSIKATGTAIRFKN